MKKIKQEKVRLPQGLPDDQTLLKTLQDNRELDLSDIARMYGLKGEDRRALRHRLKALSEAGKLDKRGRKTFGAMGQLPETGVVEVVERDIDGELWVKWGKPEESKTPLARLAPLKKSAQQTPPKLYDRLYVRFEKVSDGWVAHLVKVLDQDAPRLVGVVRKGRREIRLESVNRKEKDSYVLTGAKIEELEDGDVVLAAPAGGNHRYGPKPVRVVEVIGKEDSPRIASIMAIHSHGLPVGFQSSTEDEAKSAKAPDLGKRTDLRDLPFITIDPVDAKDHDDAVYAHDDDDAANPGGFVVWVAIADVAHYVTPGSSLDRDARDKGNSTYFPDRVEPMLPHVLSSGLCSLQEGENRATLAVRMVFDASGKKTGHKFVRGLMRSAAKLSYEQAQAAIDGNPDDKTGPILETLLKPLWAAHACLTRGRKARQPLAINSPERRVHLDADGNVVKIEPRISLDAMQLIEEMMIQANVSAAEELEKHRTPLIYRVHEAPSMEKIGNLADFLGTLGLPWNKGEPPRTDRFNRLLEQAKDTENAEIINEVVLRTQMQAHYSAENYGHFGLNLDKYAHFTSPIRRYADLVVHRALIRALKLGEDGLTDYEIKTMADTADHITQTERRSMQAEREAIERYIAAYLHDKVGASFHGRITGVTRFGLFVKLNDTGADGLVPVSSLGNDYYIHDDVQHALIGERSGTRWRLGAEVEVELSEAVPITGGLLFKMLSEPENADPNAPRPRLGIRKRSDGGGFQPRGKGPKKPGFRDEARGPKRGGPRDGVKNMKKKKKR
ncbi:MULTISPECIES: ribonuclease R [Asticcacaulis]|uniref:ribonuclease R n=1 Tax=Asticcacaulis TaxID=76890 RepID=UPI001FD94E9B|nr:MULTISPECIES: ribonuclease R [Asticcacaulis]MBP2160717.1 ribonuclease R [Asticcacaulis solisilvae]MDR6801762.1 ribonuclease R [Asticcacaulis sp. BE141]